MSDRVVLIRDAVYKNTIPVSSGSPSVNGVNTAIMAGKISLDMCM